MDTRNGRYDLHGAESKSFLRNAFSPNEASIEQRDAFLSEIGRSTFITETETGCEIYSSNIDMKDVLNCLSKRNTEKTVKKFAFVAPDDSDDWMTEKSCSVEASVLTHLVLFVA